MQSPIYDGDVTKAEIAFATFPCGPYATEAERVLQCLDGFARIVFDPTVRRVTVLFDPTRVDIPLILSTLEAFGGQPRVISVASPMMRAF